jgi:glycosyltransferase involved in cell wall biosynthesis
MDDPVTLVLVNGPAGHVQGPRARALFPEARIVYKEGGRTGSAAAIWSAVRETRRGWIYCIDLGFPSSLLAAVRRVLPPGVRLAYEIGDPMKPLFAAGQRSRGEVAIAHAFDRFLPAVADRLVFRGSYLADYFRGIHAGRTFPPWTWLPDGVDTSVFLSRREDEDVKALRKAHGLEGRLVVGIVGSVYTARTGLFYGWDLVEALALLPRDLPVTGVVVGDGPGMPALEAARDRHQLGDRLKLVGRVPHAEVPRWMNVFDVGLSTQTNGPVGWGRTTAKLPEYLASEVVVIATDVGEAHRWLRDSGQTLRYEGAWRDEAYPARLAARIRELLGADLAPLRAQNRALAMRLFDYRVLRDQIREFLGEA